MKIIDKNGKVLLEVFKSTFQGVDSKRLFGIRYYWRVPDIKCDIYGDTADLFREHQRIENGNAWVKVVGKLPQPVKEITNAINTGE